MAKTNEITTITDVNLRLLKDNAIPLADTTTVLVLSDDQAIPHNIRTIVIDKDGFSDTLASAPKLLTKMQAFFGQAQGKPAKAILGRWRREQEPPTQFYTGNPDVVEWRNLGTTSLTVASGSKTDTITNVDFSNVSTMGDVANVLTTAFAKATHTGIPARTLCFRQFTSPSTATNVLFKIALKGATKDITINIQPTDTAEGIATKLTTQLATTTAIPITVSVNADTNTYEFLQTSTPADGDKIIFSDITKGDIIGITLDDGTDATIAYEGEASKASTVVGITTATCTFDAFKQLVIRIPNTTETNFDVSITGAPNFFTTGEFILSTSSETPIQAYTEVKVRTTDFYLTILDNASEVQNYKWDDVKALAAQVETENRQLVLIENSDTALTPNIQNDIGAQVKGANYLRTKVVYTANVNDEAVFAFLGVPFSYPSATRKWSLNTLTGVQIISILSFADLSVLIAKGYTYFLLLPGETTVSQDSTDKNDARILQGLDDLITKIKVGWANVLLVNDTATANNTFLEQLYGVVLQEVQNKITLNVVAGNDAAEADRPVYNFPHVNELPSGALVGRTLTLDNVVALTTTPDVVKLKTAIKAII